MAGTQGARRILITDCHELAGLGALRSLGSAGHQVIVSYPEHLAKPAGAWSKYCTRVITYPDPWLSQPAFQDWMLFQSRTGDFDVVLPVSEASVFGVAAQRQLLPQHVIAVLPSDSALQYTLSKFHATRKALEIGIPCPATAFISDGISVFANRDLRSLCYPIVIKTDNLLRPDGSYAKGRSWKAASLKSAEYILDDLAEHQNAIIAQEYLPGSGAGSFFLRYGETTCLTFAHRRIHEVPYSGGWSSFRESVVDPELRDSGEKLLNAIDFEGAAMVEYRRSAQGGRPYFLEINGRLWGSLALALHCGVDFPRVLVDCFVRGTPAPPASEYPVGVKCRNVFSGEIGYVASILKSSNPISFKAKAIAGFFALSMNPSIRHDHFWLSDPLPGFAQAAGVLSQLLRRAAGAGIDGAARLAEWFARARNGPERRTTFVLPRTQVMFVCYGNICRSPFAQAYWNERMRTLGKPGPTAVSSGFLPRHGRRSPAQIRDIALSFNVDLTSHRSKPIEHHSVAAAEAIFVMDRQNLEDFLNHYPWAKHKVHLLARLGGHALDEIEDPFGSSDEDVRECFENIRACIDRLLEHRLDD